MIDLSSSAGFVRQFFSFRLNVDILNFQDLQSHFAVERNINGPVGRAHPPLTEQGCDLEIIELRAGLEKVATSRASGIGEGTHPRHIKGCLTIRTLLDHWSNKWSRLFYAIH